MSRERDIEIIRFQLDGEWTTSVQRQKRLPTLGSVPSKARLVDVVDAEQHLLAVIVAASSVDGLVLVAHAAGIAARVAIVGPRFVGVLEAGTDGTDIRLIDGSESETLTLFCAWCRAPVSLPAERLVDTMARTSAPRRVKRLVLTA